MTRLSSSAVAALRGSGLAEASIALLLVSALFLPPIAGGKAWPLALAVLLALAGYTVVRERRIPPVPAFIVAYVAVYALAAIHGGSLSASDGAQYFLRPLAAIAVATVVVTVRQRRRVLGLVVLFAAAQIPVTAVQTVQNVISYGRNAVTGADSVTGTFGDYQAGIVALVALAAATLVCGAWLADALRTRDAALVVAALLAVGVFTATRAVIPFAFVVAAALAVAALAFGADRPAPRRLLALVAAAIVAGPLLYGATEAIYPGAFRGVISSQQADVLGGAAAQGIEPPATTTSTRTEPTPASASSMSPAVPNGGFEQDAAGWSTAGGRYWISGGGTLARVTTEPLHGAGAGRLVAAAPRQGAWTPVNSLSIGQSYTASVWVRGRGAGALTFGEASAAATDVRFVATGEWERHAATWVASVSAARVYVRITSPSGEIEIDDVELEKEAIPVAQATPPVPPHVPSGVELLPGRVAQLRLAFRLSVRDGVGTALLGRGFGTATLDPKYTLAQEVPLPQRTGPTWIGTILTETGWLGLTAFAGLLLWLAFVGRTLWRRGLSAVADRSLAAALPGLAALTAVGGAFATILDVRGYSIVFWVLVGIAISALHDRRASAASVAPASHM